jgi:hypothetical protein
MDIELLVALTSGVSLILQLSLSVVGQATGGSAMSSARFLPSAKHTWELLPRSAGIPDPLRSRHP